MFDKLIKLTTLLSTILIFNGVLYLTIYYNRFGIKIFSYLQFSEIITAFLDNIGLILIFFGIYILNSGMTILGYTKVLNMVNNTPMPESDKQETIRHMSNTLKIGFTIKVIITLIVALLVIKGYIMFRIWMIYFLSMVFFDIIDIAFEKFNNHLNKTLSNSQYRLIQSMLIFVLPFTVFTAIIAQFNANQTKQKAQEVIIIQKNDYKLHTGKYNELIGKTNNYIFLYDSDSQSSMSLSLSDVKSIEYH